MGKGRRYGWARRHMGESRIHPDLFTPEEAATYLHLDSVRGLETCRESFGLTAHRGINKSFLYHREDLDVCALRMCGKDQQWRPAQARQLRLAGSR